VNNKPIDILVGLPAGEGEEPELEGAEDEEGEEEAPKAPDQEAIIAEIRSLLDQLEPAVSSMG